MFDLNEERLGLWKDVLKSLEASRISLVNEKLNRLAQIERFWAFPGPEVFSRLAEYLAKDQIQLGTNLVQNIVTKIQEPRLRYFIPYETNLDQVDYLKFNPEAKATYSATKKTKKKPCFEILIFHPDPATYYPTYQYAFKNLQSERDDFFYDILFVKNLADAVTALATNSNIQACVAVSGCVLRSDLEISNQILESFMNLSSKKMTEEMQDNALLLKMAASFLRPEIENYYISEIPFLDLPFVYFEKFNRVFYHLSPFKDLHYFSLNGLRQRFNTPFFNALYTYSQKPKTVFHALPVSQGGSVNDSIWTNDFYEFYGKNIFDAETSSTQRGLDSLLNPKGAIKNAQEKASKAFGSDRSFFVTNGTSTSNKIILQATLCPDDIVFVSSDCHKSIPYGVVQTGASVHFLQTNPVEEYDLYGAVHLAQILQKINELKDLGLLHKLKMIVLTNSTFDGLLYDVESYMIEILALKSDIIFFWDEAWFAHAHFHPLYKKRHSMSTARNLHNRFLSTKYIEEYNQAKDKSALPNPTEVKVRVYSSQSTHKTLSSFRQGSMIHILDDDFNADIFLDAFYTHTSTSPNYQILASLDVARRQMSIEGFELMARSLRLANWFYEKLSSSSKVSNMFKVISVDDMFPGSSSSEEVSQASHKMYKDLIDYQSPGFRFDPTRINLDVSKTGLTGGQFRKLLINKYNIQVNKTSRNTVLFIINIGATEESIKYLFKTLADIADHFTGNSEAQGIKEKRQTSCSMPQNRRYHDRYLPFPEAKDSISIVNIRQAYYDSYNSQNVAYLEINRETIAGSTRGEKWVSASFVTPYPPGFPLLVPGQIIDHDILNYLAGIINDEIHGFDSEKGLKVFSQSYLSEE